MSFSLLAPKELTQWADVRTPLAMSQMQTIEPWPTSKENFWSHGIALASQKCITRAQLSTAVSLHKEGKAWGGEVTWAYSCWWSLRKRAQSLCLFALWDDGWLQFYERLRLNPGKAGSAWIFMGPKQGEWGLARCQFGAVILTGPFQTLCFKADLFNGGSSESSTWERRLVFQLSTVIVYFVPFSLPQLHHVKGLLWHWIIWADPVSYSQMDAHYRV